MSILLRVRAEGALAVNVCEFHFVSRLPDLKTLQISSNAVHEAQQQMRVLSPSKWLQVAASFAVPMASTRKHSKRSGHLHATQQRSEPSARSLSRKKTPFAGKKKLVCCYEPIAGVEPATFPLQRECSTTKLNRHNEN